MVDTELSCCCLRLHNVHPCFEEPLVRCPLGACLCRDLMLAQGVVRVGANVTFNGYELSADVVLVMRGDPVRCIVREDNYYL